MLAEVSWWRCDGISHLLSQLGLQYAGVALPGTLQQKSHSIVWVLLPCCKISRVASEHLLPEPGLSPIKRFKGNFCMLNSMRGCWGQEEQSAAAKSASNAMCPSSCRRTCTCSASPVMRPAKLLPWMRGRERAATMTTNMMTAIAKCVLFLRALPVHRRR